MARIDQWQNRESIDIGSSPNAPNRVAPTTLAPIEVPYRQVPDYAGAAMEGLGGAIAGTAGRLGAYAGDIAERRRVTADNSWFSKARAGFVRGWMEQEAGLQGAFNTAQPVGPDPSSPAGGARAAAGTAPGYLSEGYAQFAYGEFEKATAAILETAPSEEAKQQFQQWADTYGTQVAERGLAYEEQQLFAQRAGDLNEAFTQHLQVVAADPDQFDVVWARAQEDLLNARSWMTPAQMEKAAADLRQGMELARAKRIVQTDPLRWFEETGMATGPIATTAAKIIGVESAGNAAAKNPRSSASGLGQFTDSTWLATVHKHRPDLAGQYSDADLLKLKTDPELARDMTLAHTKDNAEGLALSGIEATEGNLYLAHFAGIEGARRVLGSDPDAPIVDILGPDVVRANPFLQGKTAGWLIGWAAKRMGGAAPADMGSFVDDPRYSTLTPDQVFALTADANSILINQHNSAVSAQESINAARLNSLSLAVLDGQAGLADIGQARRDGWLYKYEDVKRLTDLVQTRDKEQINIARSLSRLGDESDRFNPFLEDDRKDVNTAYKAMGGATALSSGDKTSVGRLTSFVERTDIIPSDAVASLKAGMQSRDPNEVKASMAVMDGLYRAFPAATDRAFDEADLKRMQRYQTLSPMVPPDDLSRRMDPSMDPSTRKNREELYQQGIAEAGKVEVSEILDAFDQGWTYSEAAGPIDGQQATAMSRDFNQLYAEFYADHGNPDAAKGQALEALQRKWGVTDSGKERRIVAYPPERRYPAVNGDHDWMGAQLEETVLAEDAGAQDWGITIATETEGAWSRGEMPPYYVVYVDKDGIPRTMLGEDGRPLLFMFDDEAARGEALQQFQIDDQRARERMPTPDGSPPVTDLPGLADRWREQKGLPAQ